MYVDRDDFNQLTKGARRFANLCCRLSCRFDDVKIFGAGIYVNSAK